jgi:aldehyde dehydrogenase (NAD+)
MSRAQQAKTKKTSAKTYYNYIGGEWVKSSSGEWFENVNPADSRDVVGRFPLSNADDVNRAVAAAKSAAKRWKKTPAPKRAEILFRLGDILARNKDRYATEMTREMVKVLK